MTEVKTLTEAEAYVLDDYVQLQEQFTSISETYHKLADQVTLAENQLIDALGIEGIEGLKTLMVAVRKEGTQKTGE